MIVKEKVVEDISIDNSQISVKTETKKRDISVDLIRLFACLSVIGTHLCLQVLNQAYNRIDWGRLLEKSFFTDGVPLFFMITGFFLANGRNYKKIWKSTIMKVLTPSIIYILFSQIFYMFIVNKESIMWCLQNILTNLNIVQIFKGILTGNLTVINTLCDHLWYILSYVKIIIWIPVLWLVCKEEKSSKLARRIIIAFGIIATVITDIKRFITIPTIGAVKIFGLVDMELLYVLLGYELFVHKDKITKKVFILSAIGFIIVNFIRYRIEMQYMVLNSYTNIVGRENFLGWQYTCLNIISGLFIFTSIYSLEIKSEKISKIIIWLADKTFGIYLIHYLLIAKIDLYKFEKIERFYFEVLYLVIGIAVIFISSLVIVLILRTIKEILLNCYKKVRNNL